MTRQPFPDHTFAVSAEMLESGRSSITLVISAPLWSTDPEKLVPGAWHLNEILCHGVDGGKDGGGGLLIF